MAEMIKVRLFDSAMIDKYGLFLYVSLEKALKGVAKNLWAIEEPTDPYKTKDMTPTIQNAQYETKEFKGSFSENLWQDNKKATKKRGRPSKSKK